MSIVNVLNVKVENNPAPFSESLKFQITFECVKPGLVEGAELHWRMVYVGNSNDKKYDQELTEVWVGPLRVGKNRFILEADPPEVKLMKTPADLLDVTVMYITGSYKDKEFIRIGYYVNNDYGPDVAPEDVPKINYDITKVVRTIKADAPRVTRRDHNWDKEESKDQQDLENRYKAAPVTQYKSTFDSDVREDEVEDLAEFEQEDMETSDRDDDDANGVMDVDDEEGEALPINQQQAPSASSSSSSSSSSNV
jgi:histone chaperone ASF1